MPGFNPSLQEYIQHYGERIAGPRVQCIKLNLMKQLATFWLLVISFSQLVAAPEKILPKTLVLKSVDYYQRQAADWRQEALDNPSHPDAWLNYYTAAAFAQQTPNQLDKILAEMSAAVPNTYEWLVVKGWHEGYRESAQAFLTKAFALQPYKPEAHGLLQLTSELDLNGDKRQLYSKLLFDNSQISPSLLAYSYNVLMSVAPSAVLITEGESTTIPLFVLQDVLNIRKDVSILNLDLLSNTQYMEKKFQALGLQLLGPMSQNNLRSTLCSLLPQSNQQRKFYYALTVSKDNLSSMKEYLYVVGLASLHSVSNVDNVAQIRRNLEKEFLLDYLRVDFNGESPDATGKVLSSNYLVPMLLLYESYVNEGKQEQARGLRHLMERIARENGKESAMAKFLGVDLVDAIPYFPYPLEVKMVDGKLRHFSEKLFAFESEVTNEQFNRFLGYLKSNDLTELLDKFKYDFTEYTEPALSMMKSYSANVVATRKSKFFTQHPAVNMSHEAATAYCEWLSDQYNHAADRKFKRVKFRLPTIDEWQLAAASIKDPVSWKWDDQTVEVRISEPGHDMTKHAEKKIVSLKDPTIGYPWFRYWNMRSSPVNTRGCYLGNFKAPDSITCPGMKSVGQMAADGFATMAPTRSYFPNDIGLYDVVGNAAEMTLEKGKACGGSWNHSPEESMMRSINLYSKPDASIGFRVFMEIIEK